jgi:hypothetical protein
MEGEYSKTQCSSPKLISHQLKEPIILQASDTLSAQLQSMGAFQQITIKMEANKVILKDLPDNILLDLVYIVVLCLLSMSKKFIPRLDQK